MSAGDLDAIQKLFLLTPLREGRPAPASAEEFKQLISTHAPAGGATARAAVWSRCAGYFYSRPCGRGDFRFGRQ